MIKPRLRFFAVVSPRRKSVEFPFSLAPEPSMSNPAIAWLYSVDRKNAEFMPACFASMHSSIDLLSQSLPFEVIAEIKSVKSVEDGVLSYSKF